MVQSQTLLAQGKNSGEWKRWFRLLLDQKGISRCEERLDNTDLHYDTKHPVFSSKRHHLAVLIVRNGHERIME